MFFKIKYYRSVYSKKQKSILRPAHTLPSPPFDYGANIRPGVLLEEASLVNILPGLHNFSVLVIHVNGYIVLQRVDKPMFKYFIVMGI